ncbi:hypothetical protein TcBrA4_0089950 [Trypanosoma cruzi]|nr:hypothetical protein TcBrA4_0089950 [Trypanosoma cruzi]
MIHEMCFQELSDSILPANNGEVALMLATGSPFTDAMTTAAAPQQDVWGSSLFSLPELGTDLHSEVSQQNIEKSGSNLNCELQTASTHVCNLAPVTFKEEQNTTRTTESNTTFGPTPSMHCLSFGSVNAQSNMPSIANSTPNPLACSMVCTSQAPQLSFSSLMSIGNTTVPANSSSTTNCLAYQQASPVATVSNSIPAFFTTAQNGGNVVMFAPSNSQQTLCIPTPVPTMIPYYVIAPPQHTVEVNGTMAYSSLSTAPQSMPPVMCGPWTTNTGSVVGSGAPTPVSVSSTSAVMPQTFVTSVTTKPSQPVSFSFPSRDNNQNSASAPSIIPQCADGSGNQKAPPRGSPPSYDSLRIQITKRRQPSGRQRSGTNVHGSLQGICSYYSYNLSAALKQYEHPDSHVAKPVEQVLPVFVQMFPCELRDRTIIVLNRVVEATCGPDIATVVGIEPRSETSFIALIRTNDVWHLIHKLRCRVLMDRHGFWYAENMEQYLRLKEYCESVRRLPQQIRHFQTDGLPCMPLVVELSRSVNAASVTSLPAPPSFDEVAPIATMERHGRVATLTGSNEDGSLSPRETGEVMNATAVPLPSGVGRV